MPTRLLHHYLEKENVSSGLKKILTSIARAGKYVAHAIQTGDLGLAGTSNMYGESQLALDVLADRIFTDHLKATGIIHSLASEEKDDAELVDENGEFSIAFDPLDGSSLVNTNLSVGAIFGIFEGQGFLGKKGSEMISSCYLVFGPRLVFVLAFKNKIFEFTLNELGEFALSRKNIEISTDAKMFAPGNLRASTERNDYTRLVEHWQKKPLTLRYSGGMVPDIHAIFCKENGIFSYPSFSGYPNGKLRLLFECAPFAFCMERASGSALDEHGKRILDIEITEIHQRTTIFIGSSNEVKNAIKYLS